MKVSVIIATYNAMPFIEDALESLKNKLRYQSAKAGEVILLPFWWHALDADKASAADLVADRLDGLVGRAEIE
jgi:hypothetical protein